MTDPVVCPQCREQLDIPAEYRGPAVRCGNCQTVFTPPAADGIPTLPSRPRTSHDTHAPPRARRLPDAPPPRRSNVLVWVFLLVTVVALGGCCGGYNLVLYVACNPAFTSYTPADGDYKVEFPTPTAAPAPPADTPEKGAKVVAVRDLGQRDEEYAVAVMPLARDLADLTPDEALDRIADAEVKAAKCGPERNRKHTTHDGRPAVDVFAETNRNPFTRQAVIARCVLAGEKVYVVSVRGPGVQAELWWVRKFFLSFTLTNPAETKDK